MKKIVVLTILSIVSISLFSQVPLDKKKIQALKIDETIIIDGQLEEAAWHQAAIARDFTQLDPIPGKKESMETKVKVLYDNTGIYIAGIMVESSKDSVFTELSARDDIGNVDWFGVFLDTYMDGINASEFIITAAGVQFDAKASENGEDTDWNAIWESAISINENGWIAEIKIPYSAIRFPQKEEQLWHINFGRKTARSQEKSFWSEIKPKVDGFINQSGVLTGISGIKSPVRLSATPFIAVYGLHHKEDGVNSFGRSFNGGMDVKYGINDAFTLDMTLIPDFGETKSDDEVLNLSPFEVRYQENRQFFTEGTELFSKGRFFYSRRVGGQPIHLYEAGSQLNEGETLADNPNSTQLINATKISGRTDKGLGIGLFNATSSSQHAIIINEEGEERKFQTAPLTNYNVLVLDQNLKNNSSFSFINTTVFRNGIDYDANLTGMAFSLKNKAKSFELSGRAGLSQKYFSDRTDLGYLYDIDLDKISGNLTYGISASVESDTYDPNDLGFIYNNNERSFGVRMNYQIYDPIWKFNRMGMGLWMGYSRLFSPDLFTDTGINAWWWGQTKNFWNYNIWTYFTPTRNIDHFESRHFGHAYKEPRFYNVGVNINTDRRKKLRVSISTNLGKTSDENQYNWGLYARPRYRINNKLTVGISASVRKTLGYAGYVTNLGSEETDDLSIIFGGRNRTTAINGLSADYNFNNKMNLTFRLRHYWSKVEYGEFFELQDNGELAISDYYGEHASNYNAFNIDLVYTWRFAPGSDLIVVWKNAISENGNIPAENYFSNLNNILDLPQSNTISVKAVYYLDYLRFAGR